jgi:hypothetical protein
MYFAHSKRNLTDRFPPACVFAFIGVATRMVFMATA